jgi:hypothetical protein
MMNRRVTGWQGALRGIALALAVAHIVSPRSVAAQGGASGADEEGDCTPSRDPPECADRCPSFDTCYIDDGEGQLYYRVNAQRFDCDGLECREASATLADYCCRRGQFAPSRGGGGGCTLQPESGAASAYGRGSGSWLVALGACLARRGVAPRRGRPPLSR